MPIFTVENHVNVSLISLHIAPSTAIVLTILLFIYLYIVHSRDYPLSDVTKRVQEIQSPAAILEPRRNGQNHDPNYRRAGRSLRRPPFFGRFASRFRASTGKQRDRTLPAPAVFPSSLWVSFPSFGLPFGGQRGGSERLDRQIFPAGLETRRGRKEKQRLLE